LSLPPDIELIERYIEGDKDAFLTLISRYRGLIRYCCAKIFEDEDVVEDLTQETLFRILAKIDRFDPNRKDANFRNWAATIAFRIALNCRRRMLHERRIKNTFDEESIETPEEHNPRRSLQDKETYSALHAAVDMLPEPTRTHVVEFYFNGFSIDDICKAHASKKWQVKHQLHRGRKLLRKALRR
jgi:RNA polymerase sigma-70 factor (ECF subfamily)